MNPGEPPERLTPEWLGARLQQLIGALRGRQLCVAFSGGLDSSVLLAALCRLRGPRRLSVRALHVNHQLQPQAAHWAQAAGAQARRARVAFERIDIKVMCRRGESLEAAARTARYRALAQHLRAGELLVTAHHQEDQLETVLLALLRGSGVRGLAAMNAVTAWNGTLLLRPLLPISRSRLEDFAREHALLWSEDPSNRDERFDRNYLRRRVLPLIRERWPAAAATVARSAAHLGEARALLEQQALEQLKAARDGPALRVSVLSRLTAAQRGNALRHWIAERGLVAPDHRRLREITGPMLRSRADALPVVRWQGGELRRHGDRLFALQASASGSTAPPAEQLWDWRAQPWLALSGGSALGLTRERHGDVRLAALPPRLRVHFRHGGERLHTAHGRLALKTLLQAQGLTPWERATVPLIGDGECIIAVADLWLDPDYRAGAAAGTRAARSAAATAALEAGRFRWRRA
ncbi:MAG: tRNA lysidine(34) synthetase TilS [Steroidobacteraceae bacterium]